MKTVKLVPKASQDLEAIWYYGCHHFGENQADKYINSMSDIYSTGTPSALAKNTVKLDNISTPCHLTCI